MHLILIFCYVISPTVSYSWSCYEDCSLCNSEYVSCLAAVPPDKLDTESVPGVVVESGVIKMTKTHKEACERQRVECLKTCGKNCKDGHPKNK